MSDLIKRSDAIDVINEAFDIGDCCCDRYGIIGAIQSISSADRPQGEWIESFKPITVKQEVYPRVKYVHDGWSCSVCSEHVEKKYPNCPYCLAKMKGVDDE